MCRAFKVVTCLHFVLLTEITVKSMSTDLCVVSITEIAAMLAY